MTGRSEEDVVVALHDAKDDPHRAVEILLEGEGEQVLVDVDENLNVNLKLFCLYDQLFKYVDNKLWTIHWSHLLLRFQGEWVEQGKKKKRSNTLKSDKETHSNHQDADRIDERPDRLHERPEHDRFEAPSR